MATGSLIFAQVLVMFFGAGTSGLVGRELAGQAGRDRTVGFWFGFLMGPLGWWAHGAMARREVKAAQLAELATGVGSIPARLSGEAKA